ncbi:MAG: dTMP kinase [Steroidobacteraceae bacterium]
MLIAFEGLDGSGKTTQAKLLHRWLSKRAPCVFTDWNSSRLIAPAIRRAKRKHAFTPLTYCLFHAADFADRHERIIGPALANGQDVVCDRYVWTAYARDGARGLLAASQRLYDFAREPDLVFYIRIPVDIASARKKRKPHYYEAGRDVYPRCDAREAFSIYQAKVGSFYEQFAARFVVVDGLASAKQQQKLIRAMVEHYRERRGAGPAPVVRIGRARYAGRRRRAVLRVRADH